MKSIYIIFSGTDLKTGKAIRFFTNACYNHVSISLDNLRTLNSFSRVYLRHPMVGGFVQESPNRYLMMSKETVMKVVKIDVDSDTYDLVVSRIQSISLRSEDYVYNYMSIAGYALGRRIKCTRAYTCAEFVRDTLVEAGLLCERGSAKVSIESLMEELSSYPSEEGKAYEMLTLGDWGNDEYLRRIGRVAALKESLRRLRIMMLRN